MSDKLYDLSGHDALVSEDCSYILFRGDRYVRLAEVAAHLEELADGYDAAKISRGFTLRSERGAILRAAAESVRGLGERP